MTLKDEIEWERRRNLEDVIRHARWEARMVLEMGVEWFRARDNWLVEAWEADKEMWKNPKVREALIKAILAKDRVKRERGDP